MKKQTAAQRTLVHPLVDMREQAQPEPYVKMQSVVSRRIVDGAIHFFAEAGPSLCKDVRLSYLGARDKSYADYGTCAACRVEASRIRAVVR